MDELQYLSDVELVKLARGGDKTAFGELVRRYERAARTVVAERIGNRDNVMDIVQDGFVRAFCKLGQLQELERFGGWLRTIMVREALGSARDRCGVREVTSLDLDAAVKTPPQSDGDTRRQKVREAVEILPAQYREVVALHC